jgi:hypothetical protein
MSDLGLHLSGVAIASGLKLAGAEAITTYRDGQTANGAAPEPSEEQRQSAVWRHSAGRDPGAAAAPLGALDRGVSTKWPMRLEPTTFLDDRQTQVGSVNQSSTAGSGAAWRGGARAAASLGPRVRRRPAARAVGVIPRHARYVVRGVKAGRMLWRGRQLLAASALCAPPVHAGSFNVFTCSIDGAF